MPPGIGLYFREITLAASRLLGGEHLGVNLRVLDIAMQKRLIC